MFCFRHINRHIRNFRIFQQSKNHLRLYDTVIYNLNRRSGNFFERIFRQIPLRHFGNIHKSAQQNNRHNKSEKFSKNTLTFATFSEFTFFTNRINKSFRVYKFILFCFKFVHFYLIYSILHCSKLSTPSGHNQSP